MPNTISAIRRAKKTKLQTSVNKIRKGKYKSTIKQMSNFIAAGKAKEAKDFFPKFNSQLMKIAKTGLIDKRTVSRKISRISKKIQKIKS
ncbi:MAG TPA: 30S ribosomal protein S20 [Candidatus Pelagibacter sp.]|jgi:small subunit ribosomal protein S20|nr:30S ribosomal protein S20 [Candidatus Pelagibacter sp.]